MVIYGYDGDQSCLRIYLRSSNFWYFIYSFVKKVRLTKKVYLRFLEVFAQFIYLSCTIDSSCVQPLGMRSGGIKGSQLLSSSFHKETHFALGHSPSKARFGGAGYWSPVGGSASIDSEQFLQITFKTPIQLKMVCSKMLFKGKNTK